MGWDQGPVRKLGTTEKSSDWPHTLSWLLQFSLWGQDATPRQHLARLCQSQRLLENCFGRTWQSVPPWVSRAPGYAAWTWLLPTPKDMLSLFLCLADPKLQLYLVSGQFPLVLCMYPFFTSLFWGISEKHGSILFVRGDPLIKNFCCLAASPAVCPRPSPARISYNALNPRTVFS